MNLRARSLFAAWLPSVAAGLAVLLVATAGQAQYKVIGADGKVTYTDREPSGTDGRVMPLGARAQAQAQAQAAEPDLPFELRQTAGKYPVVLYTASRACEACGTARQLLKQRGVPFSERIVVSDDDVEALERLSGGRDVPTLTIGSQTLRGLAPDVWNSYLEAAGYPRESKLPANYQYRPATPLVARREPAATAPGPVNTGQQSGSTAATPAGATVGGIRF